MIDELSPTYRQARADQLESSDEGSTSWWHHHGYKMAVQEEPNDHQLILVTSSQAAMVVITYLPQGIEGLWVGQWQVEYSVRFGVDHSDGGRRIMDTATLATAFRVDMPPPEHCIWSYIAKKVNASYGLQGYFVRLRRHLNIPMPGTGNDGDPNVSIYLEDEITAAVRSLIRRCESE